MSFLDNFLDVMRLNPDAEGEYLNQEYNYDYDYDDDDDDGEEPSFEKTNSKTKKTKRERQEESNDDMKEKITKQNQKITPIRASKKNVGNAKSMTLYPAEPTSLDDAKDVAKILLSNHPVIVNMEGLVDNATLAQRIMDFISGSVYIINGTLRSVSKYIFIAAPSSVDISEDLLKIVDSMKKKEI